MTTAAFAPQVDSLIRTDSVLDGCESGRLDDLTADLSRALHQAIWSFMLQADLEEELDGALLRSAISETPVLAAATAGA